QVGADGSTERVQIKTETSVCFSPRLSSDAQRFGIKTSYRGEASSNGTADTFWFVPEKGVSLPKYWFVPEGSKC
ncbi:MAG: hypothetical protein AAB555_03190, partial [Patescibacteria group bacterium]